MSERPPKGMSERPPKGHQFPYNIYKIPFLTNALTHVLFVFFFASCPKPIQHLYYSHNLEITTSFTQGV